MIDTLTCIHIFKLLKFLIIKPLLVSVYYIAKNVTFEIVNLSTFFCHLEMMENDVTY